MVTSVLTTYSFGVKGAGRLASRQERIGQKRADLVSGKGSPGSIGGGSQPGGTAQPVAVGVGGQDQVRANLFASGDHRVENNGIFGIGHVARDVTEIRIGRCVRTENFYVFESGRAEHRADRGSATPCSGE